MPEFSEVVADITGGMTLEEVGIGIKRSSLGSKTTAAFCGDSITDDGENNGSWYDIGWICWFRRLCGDSLEFNPDYVYAIQGMGTEHLINTQLPQLLSDKPDIVFTMIGTNDLSLEDYDYIVSRLQTYYDEVEAAGIYAVAMPILPRTTLTDGMKSVADGVNRWLYKRSKTHNTITFINTISGMLDTSTGSILAAYTADGLHTNRLGAYALGKIVFDAVPDIAKGESAISVGVDADYSATLNPTGNLSSNEFLLGSGGLVQGSATGVSPDGCRIISSGTTVLNGNRTSVSDYASHDAFSIELSGTADGSTSLLITPDGVVPSDQDLTGKRLVFDMDVDFVSIENIEAIYLGAEVGGVTLYDGSVTGNGNAEYNVSSVKLRVIHYAGGFQSGDTVKNRLYLRSASAGALSGSVVVKRARVYVL